MSRRKQLRPFKVQDDDDCNANHTNGLDNCLSIPSNGDHAEVLTSNQELDGVAGVDGVVYNLKSKNDDESICNEMGPSIDENGEGKKDQKLHVENGQIDKPTIADGSENNPPENVTLDALENAKAAVAQFAAAALAKGADGSSAKDLTMIQSALFTLQHQQVFQMQLIEQLQFQLAKSNTRKDNKKSTESKTKQDDGENEENQTDTVIADNFPSNQIKCDDDEIKTIVQKEPKSNDESKDDEKLIASDDPTDSNISATLASDIITNHDSDLRSDEPNSLQLLQKRAEEVLDSASQSFTTGSLIDELSYRTGAFFNDGPSDDPSMKHRCRFCGKIFGSDSALQIHLRSHTGERPFVCRVCGSRFTTKGNLKVHYQRHTETMNYAEEVKKDVIPPYDFRAQTKQHTSKHADKTPSESPFDLTNKSDKEDNYFNNSNETHDSDSESPKFDDDGGVRNILNFDQEYSSSKKEAWEKFMEIVDTPKATELQQDEAYRVDPNKCPICNRLLSCRSALRQHYRTHTGERPFRCRLCARSFTTKGNLKTHIGVHKINPLLSPVHSCTLCHKKYSTAHALQQHINTHTGAPIEMTIDQIRAAEVREFVSRDSLSELYGSNSSLGDCNETSTRDSDFDAAPKSLDADTRNMSKVDLSDSEDSRSRLKRTPQNVEKEIDKMRTNFNYSTSPEPKRHCNESEKVPRNDSTAVPLSSPSHILGANLNPLLAANSFNPVVFSSGVRGNTTCNICFKTLACQSALEIHYRSHTKEKPYVCQLCNRGFSTKGNMKQHMLTHKIRDMPQHVFRNSTQSPSSDSNNSLSATGYQTQTSTDAPAELTHDDTHADRIVRQLKTKDEFDKNANAATVDQSDAMYLSSDDSGSMSLAVRPKNGLTNFNEINDDSDKMKNADVRPTTTPTDDSHAERNNKTSRKLPSKSNRDYCRICCKHFGSFSALDTHMRSHTGAKPFLCTICDKSFSTKGNLKVHVAAHSWTNDANRSNHRNPLDMPSFPQLNPYGLQRPADLFNPFIANAAALQQKLHEANLYQKYVNAANMREFAGDAKHNDELLHRNLFGLAHLPFQMFNDHIDPSMKNK